MNKLASFVIDGKNTPISYVETIQVKAGVECDVYTLADDTSKDLAIVHVSKGSKTPLQKVLLGDKTIEGFVSGIGTLTITDGTNVETCRFSEDRPGSPVAVQIGQTMQWQADDSADLTFYEICQPPYRDGRFENLPE